MDSSDRLGLVAYNFEPEYTSEELLSLSSEGDLTVEESEPVEDWCTCDNCAEMANADENICCKTSDLTVGSLDSYDCITDHRNFDEIVLNPIILAVAFIQIMAFKGQTGRAPDHLLNRYSFI